MSKAKKSFPFANPSDIDNNISEVLRLSQFTAGLEEALIIHAIREIKSEIWLTLFILCKGQLEYHIYNDAFSDVLATVEEIFSKEELDDNEYSAIITAMQQWVSLHIDRLISSATLHLTPLQKATALRFVIARIKSLLYSEFDKLYSFADIPLQQIHFYSFGANEVYYRLVAMLRSTESSYKGLIPIPTPFDWQPSNVTLLGTEKLSVKGQDAARCVYLILQDQKIAEHPNLNYSALGRDIAKKFTFEDEISDFGATLRKVKNSGDADDKKPSNFEEIISKIHSTVRESVNSQIRNIRFELVRA